jgi:hypothetical protein
MADEPGVTFDGVSPDRRFGGADQPPPLKAAQTSSLENARLIISAVFAAFARQLC